MFNELFSIAIITVAKYNSTVCWALVIIIKYLTPNYYTVIQWLISYSVYEIKLKNTEVCAII